MEKQKTIEGIFVPNSGRRWTQQEIALIKVRLASVRTKAEWDMTIDDLAHKMGRTNKAVISMANKTIGKMPQVRKGYLVRDDKPAVNTNRRIHVYAPNRGRIREALTCLALGGGAGYIMGVASALFYLG